MENILDFAVAAPATRAEDILGRWPFREQIFGALDPVTEPIVVIGAGPVGMSAVQELARRAPHRHIIWYGAERAGAYDRLQLTSLVAGEVDIDAVTRGYRGATSDQVERRFGCAVTQIDRHARLVIDQRHRFQSYSTLILATGSTPHIPESIDSRLAGVFTLSRLKDAKALTQRRKQSCCTVVLGGGMLGLEAARAMQGTRTKVVVLEQSERLLPRQLDASAATLLKEYLEARGISILLNAQVQQVYGHGQLQGLLLADRALPCDTLIIATGSDPNVELARMAGLRVNRGIEIDDRTLTSDPSIHAIGECAEHRGVSYGAVGPGLEQARVAAAITTGAKARYSGSIPVTRLKVIDIPVFSMGSDLNAVRSSATRVWTHRSPDGNSRVRLLTRDGHVVGASAIGHATDMDQLQRAVTEQVRLRPWHLLRFFFTGRALSTPRVGTETQDSPAASTSNAPSVICEPTSQAVNTDFGVECSAAEQRSTAAPLGTETATAGDTESSESGLASALPVAQPVPRTAKPATWSMMAATALMDLSAPSEACATQA